MIVVFYCFQAEDGIRDLVRSRGLGDVYKRQEPDCGFGPTIAKSFARRNVLRVLQEIAAQSAQHLSLIHI